MRYVEAPSREPVRGEAGPVDGVWSTTDVGLVRGLPSAEQAQRASAHGAVGWHGVRKSHTAPQLVESNSVARSPQQAWRTAMSRAGLMMGHSR